MPLLMCPNDNSPMQEITRNGVLIDVCPQCRGVWLDRGELEKLLELVGRPAARTTEAGRSDHRDDHGERDRYGRRRKKRFDLFDFFD